MVLKFNLAAEAADPAVAGLDLGVLSREDLANLVLQRSEILFDAPEPGKIIRAWEAGDNGPMEREIDRLGEALARRAAGVIHAEYRALRPVLQSMKPTRLADIGCGYAFFDLFAARDLGVEIVLIDLESNERRHFGFQEEGAAYSSLAKARALLEANGIAPGHITTINPRDVAPETIAPVDLAVSFLSCGFHYPVDSYLPFLDKALMPGGAAIFDLRGRTAGGQSAKLAPFGSLSDLDSPPKARRVLLRKEAG
ncbi:class I SAM-dependent methyltransferase [Szabonella alba]|uniref:Class I SAM-dependent methyltransferase n=1 Tax=Szabonella alba TaxID=2804194 RepID=A0A8K0V6A7_9RHOB|nr:class I SAM-dependent methyltransferase [Szabonella alba]MBL4915971.1 class I SAM-dependent methyltransferase [Szabonella alba]